MLQKNRLWKVRLIHYMGYEAPYFFVETSSSSRAKAHSAELEAIEKAKLKTRLADFPNKWEIAVEQV